MTWRRVREPLLIAALALLAVVLGVAFWSCFVGTVVLV